MVDNNYYGGFIVSNNIIKGNLPKYSFREKSNLKQLNGWNLYSEIDDNDYVNKSHNFTILNAESLFKIVPVMQELFEAPYGTDLCWLYEDGVLTGFYDLKNDKDTTIQEILNLS